ncbi:hypothetical protein TG4357_03714 [Thalassovita gelatinovora]|uniref:Uncharacterized protein n=1 Tax=Thalassovita gelatinovora TaxID=53501 RepID=A0A0P1G7P7_THAGE|nr:hypothetical protein [Thalassovita gelatinovora]QIZ79049.1 hypothetical protein HFZ77_00445 [Thalassovita gelatinovora]CUH68643.1 hypothetical protein TG4357_03714 [Thalassovita gelatinovora]SEQ55984.1 hypothetical protein SAMN04488043_106175 [Thalassovita gelatinovora]
MPKCRASKAEITRAVEATQKCGLSVSGVEIEPDGTIRVLTIIVDKPQKQADARIPKQW